MKIEEYKAGEKRMCYQYECLIPSLVNHEWTWDSADMTLALERAVKALAGLDTCAQFVPDIDLFIRMHIVHEANASSRIEGTQTETGCAKFKRIFALRDEMSLVAAALPNAELAQRLFRFLYSVPRATVNQLAEALECGYQAASRLVKPLVAKGVLVASSDAKRNTIYDFKRYLDIFKD